jgi:hypothetical protein
MDESSLEVAGQEARSKPNGAGAGLREVKPPAISRTRPPILAEIGPELQHDGSPVLSIAADAVELARTTWTATCTHYEEAVGKVSPLHTREAALIATRRFSYEAKQKALRRVDASLAEIRVASREVENAIQRKRGLQPRARDDITGELRAAEIRSWLRSQPENQRMSLVERAIGAGDATVVAAALELPAIAGASRGCGDASR